VPGMSRRSIVRGGARRSRARRWRGSTWRAQGWRARRRGGGGAPAGPRPRYRGWRERKNGVHEIVGSSAAVFTARSCSAASWPGRHSSHSARSCEPATVPHPAAPWNRACGGHVGLNTCVRLRSARAVPMIVPRAAPVSTTRLILMAAPLVLVHQGRLSGARRLRPPPGCESVRRTGPPGGVAACGAAVAAAPSRSGKPGRGRPAPRRGNQTSRAGAILRGLTLPADLIATSDDWGVSKPDPAFFDAVIAAAPCEAGRIAYVGGRLDNDLRPAKAAGMRTVFVRRGLWGYIWEHHPGLPDLGGGCPGRPDGGGELLPGLADPGVDAAQVPPGTLRRARSGPPAGPIRRDRFQEPGRVRCDDRLRGTSGWHGPGCTGRGASVRSRRASVHGRVRRQRRDGGRTARSA
jgi:HAD-hyrolase-like